MSKIIMDAHRTCTGQINKTKVEATNENIYYLLSNGDVYGVGGSRGGQLGYLSSSNFTGTPVKLYSGVKRIIPQLYGLNNVCSVSMVELTTGEIKCMGNTSDYKFGYYVEYNAGVTSPITLYSKVDKIFLTERMVIAVVDEVTYTTGKNTFSGEFVTNQTKTKQTFGFAISGKLKTTLTDYKQQLPFTTIPLSTDVNDTNNPVFENLTDITGFSSNNDIIIEVPSTL